MTPFSPINLLKLLGSGIRPTDSPPANPHALAQGQAAFSSLLDKARAGELSSHKLVSIDEDSGVQLSDSQLAQLSLAADHAEAAGLRQALVIFDDQQVLLDVQARSVTKPANLSSSSDRPAILADIDGVINLSSLLPSASATAAILPPAAFNPANPSINQLLQSLASHPQPVPSRRAS